MMKRFLSGALAAALVLGTVSAVTPATADAKKVNVPKAKYTFNMNGASKNVVAVGRKGDTASLTTGGKPNMPTEAQAKAIKGKLKYAKGKHGKALYLDRTNSVGAQLKGVKASNAITVSFWIKVPNGMGDYNSAFFGASNVTEKSAKWFSVTAAVNAGWPNGGSPVIWSRNAAKNEFPWYNKNGIDPKTKKAVWMEGNELATAKNWKHITLVINNKKSCEYGTKGEDGYVKGAHAWTYVNGKLYGNGCVANGALSSANKYFLGINAWDTPMKAYYDDVQIWDKALSAKQVAQNYKNMK